MRINSLKAILGTAVRGATVLLLGAGVASAQQQINLSAVATQAVMPDGSVVPMWGYNCGILVSGSLANCAASNPGVVSSAATTSAAAVTMGWSPVIITVPSGQDLRINLTNNDARRFA